jgi:tetratricopeptide (TPR) repeat protein
VKALEDAIARQPGSAIAHELLGKARKLKGDLLGSSAALKRALDLDPRATEARLLLIEEARATKRWQDVSRYAAEGLSLTPDDRELQFELARAREAVGDNAAAARIFANILERQPQHEAARAALERLSRRR